MMSKNLIKVLAACGDDIDLEEIYNEIGRVLEKDKEIKDPEPTKKVASLHDYDGMEFEYIADARSYMTKKGFEVIGNHVYNGSESASITRIFEKGSHASFYRIICNN